MTLSGATTMGQIGPGSNGNEGVLCIPQSSSITGTSPSDCLVSYTGHSLGGLLLYRCAIGLFYCPSQHRVNVKIVLFQLIQLSISTQFRC